MEGREVFILKMKAMNIVDLAEVMIQELAPIHGYSPQDIPISIIGLRPGEKLNEHLFTYEELPYIEEKEAVFVLRNSPYDSFQPQPNEHLKAYQSDQTALMTQEEIRTLLKKEEIL